VKCSQCGFENTGESFFCSKCGGKLPASEDVLGPTKTFYVPHVDLGVGSIFARRYQIIEELGRGGMGTVYKVLDREINEKIALKILKPEISFDEKTIERFRNELKLARKISHQNVCRMYDIVKEEGLYFITMEYISGEDLKSTIIRLGQVSVGKTMRIVKQICKGLAEAHRLGVIHRDLKPQNIIIDREGEVRIMDFGIALSRRTAGITEPGVMIGTPEYMSPEQAAGKELDSRSDIYSLGIIMFELLTGTVPFKADTALGVAMMHKSEFPPDPRSINPQIPKDFSALILKCLEKDRNKRFSNCEEIVSEISKMEKGYPTTERLLPDPKKQWSAAVPRSRWRKFVVPGVFLATVMIMIGVYFLFLQPKDGKDSNKDNTVVPEPPQMGVLSISSIPKEAIIWVNENKEGIGEVDLNLPPGKYRIKISSPDYEEYREELEIKAGENPSKQYELKPLYFLQVETNPSEAKIFIDDVYQMMTPNLLTLNKSSCRLKLDKGRGWVPYEETLNLKPGHQNPTKIVKLNRMQATLRIDSDPQGAQVYVDDEPWGPSPQERTSLPLKSYKIRLVKEGYRPKEIPLTLSSNFSDKYTLERIPKATVILSAVPFAEVYIDNVLFFSIPPQKSQVIEEGNHVIEFVSRDKTKRHPVNLEIKGGETIKVHMNMETGNPTITKQPII
jgi:serine/threonine protein kinase